MPRLFVGLEIPPSAATTLSMLRGGLSGARWIDPENYHVTLRFVGDIDERRADELCDALARVRRAPFTAEIDGLGAFGGDRPRALFAAVKASPALVELQGEVERLCRRAGLDAEGRKFTPHVTLARLRGVKAGAVAQYLALRGGFGLPPFPVERFVVFSSRASVGGGPYLVEEAYPLAA